MKRAVERVLRRSREHCRFKRAWIPKGWACVEIGSFVNELATELGPTMKNAEHDTRQQGEDGPSVMVCEECVMRSEKIEELEAELRAANEALFDVVNDCCEKCTRKGLNKAGYTDKDIDDFVDHVKAIVDGAIEKSKEAPCEFVSDLYYINCDTEYCPNCNSHIEPQLKNLLTNCPDAKYLGCGGCGMDLEIYR